MKTVLVLSALLCAAFAAPAEDIEMAAEAAVEAPQEQMAAEPARFHCPPRWSNYGLHCFQVVKHPMSWFAAKDYCSNMGANLAAVTSPGEYIFLQGLLKTAKQTHAWLGGLYVQGQWLWTDRQPFDYENWSSTSPSSSSSSYSCLYAQDNKGWANSDCRSNYRFICSKDPSGC